MGRERLRSVIETSYERFARTSSSRCHGSHDILLQMGVGSKRNQPCACGSGRKYKRCCGTSSELQRRQVNRLAGDATARAFVSAARRGDLDVSELSRAQVHLQELATDRGLSHEDLAEMTGHTREHVTLALTPGSPFPMRVLGAVAQALDCRIEIREPMTIGEQAERIGQAMRKHTNVELGVAERVASCRTAQDFETVGLLFGEYSPSARDGTAEFMGSAFFVVGALMRSGHDDKAENMLDQMAVAIIQDQFRDVTAS